jgi:hypothetical protein
MHPIDTLKQTVKTKSVDLWRYSFFISLFYDCSVSKVGTTYMEVRLLKLF